MDVDTIHFRALWTRLYRVRQAVQDGSLEDQDEAINALFLVLEQRNTQHYPALFYEQAHAFLQYYLERILPQLAFDEQDRHDIAGYYRDVIADVEEAACVSQNIEQAFEFLLEKFRTEMLQSVQQVIDCLAAIAHDEFAMAPAAFEFAALSPFQQRFQLIGENFSYIQVAEFFTDILEELWKHFSTPDTSQQQLRQYNFKQLFEYVLHCYFQTNAVFVDRSRRGKIMPVWLAVDRSHTSQHVEFWNRNIDAAMQASADTARWIAGAYLRDEYGIDLPEEFAVHCLFPGQDTDFSDTSASLLLGIRIVAEVLGVNSTPATVVTGELGTSGKILRVGFINEKIAAVRHHEGIERIVLPESNIPDITQGAEHGCVLAPESLPENGLAAQTVSVIPVRTFADAIRVVLDHHREDWGEAPEPDVFYGRQEELDTIRNWILEEHCRLLIVLGMGGIGKTALIRRFAGQIKNQFQYVLWRDLRNAPLAEDVLDDCIKFLSDQQCIELPKEVAKKISLLIGYLKKYRCLIVLDNTEVILEGGEGKHSGLFRKGYEDYEVLMRKIGGVTHQSCVLLTSREKPKKFDLFEGQSIREFMLSGLEHHDARELLKKKPLKGTTAERDALIKRYNSHPLALKLVTASIHEVFHGEIAAFLQQESLFHGIQHLLDQQHERLSKREKDVVYWLAIAREAMSLSELQASVINPILRRHLPNLIDSLLRKSLLETTDHGFTLQPFVMEYFTEQIIEQVCRELVSGKIALFNSHALMKAQAEDYIRKSQIRVIFKTIVEYLEYEYELDSQEIETTLKTLLATLQEQRGLTPGYAAGNLLNFLLYLSCDLYGCNFSNLPVWQAYLQGVELHDIDFSHADLRGSVFTETFGQILAVAFSPDGAFLAAGTTTNEIRVWQTDNHTPLFTCEGHYGWVWSVAFSPDAEAIASASASVDENVRVWNGKTGACRHILHGHSGWVYAVAFSPDGRFLVTGCDEQNMPLALWDARTGQWLETLDTGRNGVYTVVFSPDGNMLASGGRDGCIILWEVSTDDDSLKISRSPLCCRKRILIGHSDLVRSLAFSPDGQLLISGSHDNTVRLWQISTGQCLDILHAHTAPILSIAISPDGQTIASGSEDATVRLWSVWTKQYLHTLQEHSSWVNTVSFSPDGKTLASGSSDQTIKLWNVSSGRCVKTLHGFSIRALSIALSADGKTVAGGFSDKTIRLWDVQTGKLLNTLKGHENWVMAVTFSADGALLASTSSDQTARVWNALTGKCLRIFRGHEQQVRSVALSPDNTTLLTGSNDKTARLWDITTGQERSCFQGAEWVLSVAFNPDGTRVAASSQDHHIYLWDIHRGTCLRTLSGHTGPVWSSIFIHNGTLLASGSHDKSIRIWDVETGNCLNVLEGHTNRIRSVATAPAAALLASGSEDTTIRLWELHTGTCSKILDGHDNWVRAVAFTPDGRTLASADEGGMIKLWDIATGTCIHTLQPDKPYERMNITGVTGLHEAQKATLRALGAVEQ